MFNPLFAWIFLACVTWIPPSSRNVPQLRNYVSIVDAIVHATDDPADAVQLASIASFESRFAVKATGKLGEQGPFQLLGNVPPTLRGQAKEALRRWKVQTPCGYTGEAVRAHQDPATCPLATHRIERAERWSREHPFSAPASLALR